MKLLTFRQNNVDAVGMLSEDAKSIVEIKAFASMQHLLESGVSIAELEAYRKSGKTVDVSAVEARSPIPHPRQDIICLGINYLDHAKESANHLGLEFKGARPHAMYFAKRCCEALPDGGIIPPHWDIVEDTLDYEVEVAVIIGKNARNVSETEALDYVFGYSILNDLTARNLQKRHGQFFFGKSLDGFTAFGPCLVTKDEVPDLSNLNLRSFVNGELRQNNNTRNLIFDIPSIISELSKGIELMAGTIIATGTPSGVGFGFDPPRFLKKGDIVRCEVDALGSLTNTVG